MNLVNVLGPLLFFIWGTQSSGDHQNGMVSEDCHNGIDDDGDYKVDAFDSDCFCIPDLIPEYLVPNGDFESILGCCNILFEDRPCLTDWFAINASPDYYSPQCNTQIYRQFQTFYSLEKDDAFASMSIHVSHGEIFNESIGVCLDQPFARDSSYRMILDLAREGNPNNPLIENVYFAVYGIFDCQDIKDLPFNSNYCELDIPSEFLFEFNLLDLDLVEFRSHYFDFTPTEDIQALAFNVRCGQVPPDVNIPLLWIDNIYTLKESSLPIIDSIQNSIINCFEDIYLHVEDHPSRSYQWYRDSLPIPEADQANLRLETHEQNQEGIYHVLITQGPNCELVGPMHLSLPQDETFIDTTICEGESVEFEGDSYYSDITLTSIHSNFYGCDSLVTFQIDVKDLTEEVVVTREICSNESVVMGGMEFTTSGIYDINYTDAFGCDSLLVLDLIVEDPLLRDTIDRNIFEGESIVFHGVEYFSEGMYEIFINSDTTCGFIDVLNLRILSNEDLESAVFIPNAFSPNGDGLHDVLLVSFDHRVINGINSQKIFDRWGNLIFESKGSDFWDGTMNGEILSSSSYIIQVEFIDHSGRKMSKVETVHLLN